MTTPPARDRKPLLVLAGVAAAVLVVGIGIAVGPHRATVAPAPSVSPPAAAGRAHVVVKGVDSASVFVDWQLVAAGIREARVPNVAPGESHHLRVEAPGRTPFEQTFTVAADAEVELAAKFVMGPVTVPATVPATAPATGPKPAALPAPSSVASSPVVHPTACGRTTGRLPQPPLHRRPRPSRATGTVWWATISSTLRTGIRQ